MKPPIPIPKRPEPKAEPQSLQPLADQLLEERIEALHQRAKDDPKFQVPY